MKTKREYEEAFDLINIFTSCGCNDVGDCNCCIAYNKRLKQQHGCELDLALNMFKELIEEHFKLKEKYSKILDDVHDYRYETHCMKMTVINLCKHFGVKSEKELQNIYLNKPYKFEDLKPNMWVYDDIEKLICQIGLISKNAVHRKYVDGTISDSPFEENRFFPAQCANIIRR